MTIYQSFEIILSTGVLLTDDRRRRAALHLLKDIIVERPSLESPIEDKNTFYHSRFKNQLFPGDLFPEGFEQVVDLLSAISY